MTRKLIVLLVLGNDLCSLDLNGDSVKRHAIETIARMAFSGNHLIALESRAVGQFLGSQTTLGENARAVFRRCVSRYATDATLVARAEVQLFVRVHPLAGISSSPQITLDDIKEFESSSSLLICEHVTDARIYEYAARHYLLESKISGVMVSLDVRGGGGSTIVPEFDQLLQRRDKFCLCITDWDASCPSQGESVISKRCRVLAENAGHRAAHFAIKARELENLIPIAVLREIVKEPSLQYAVDKLAKIISSVPESIFHLDLKLGLSAVAARKMADDANKSGFFNSLILEANCSNSAFCARSCTSLTASCSCLILNGFGENLAEPFLKWLQERAAQKSLQAFDSSARDEWLSIGRIVFWWALASDRMRS